MLQTSSEAYVFSFQWQAIVCYYLVYFLLYFFVCRCPDGITWKENFEAWYHDFGKYWNIYKLIRQAWNQIELYVKKHCPGIYSSLQGFQ